MYIGKVSVVIHVTSVRKQQVENSIKVILTDKEHFIVSCSFPLSFILLTKSLGVLWVVMQCLLPQTCCASAQRMPA